MLQYVIAGFMTVTACMDKVEQLPMYEYNAKIVNVVDGDTVDAVVDLGFKIQTAQRLRLNGIDTPERGQPGFEEAKSFVTSAINGKNVVIRTHKVSKWGYYLIDISVDGRDLAQMLLTSKLAKPYDGGTKK